MGPYFPCPPPPTPPGDAVSKHLETVTQRSCFVLFCFLPRQLGCHHTSVPPPWFRRAVSMQAPSQRCGLLGCSAGLHGAEEAREAGSSLPASFWYYFYRHSPGILWLLSQGWGAELGGSLCLEPWLAAMSAFSSTWRGSAPMCPGCPADCRLLGIPWVFLPEK